MPAQPHPAAMKIAIAALAVLLTASPGYSKPNPSASFHKIVLITRIGSACLRGDECPETRTEKTSPVEFMGEPQVLLSLLSLGWRVVSITLVSNDEGYSRVAYAVSSVYVLLEK